MPNTTHRILVVDDESALRTVLSTVLGRAGYQVATAANVAEAKNLLKTSENQLKTAHFSAVICDIRMPQEDGFVLLEYVTSHHEDIPVIMLTAHGTIDTAVSALKMGAFDFMLKPFEKEEVLLVIQKAIGQQEANRKSARLSNNSTLSQMLVGNSAFIDTLHQLIQRVADTPSTVLITGESGTGKELVAKALHQLSKRHNKPFIRINCAAIPANLIEAELFGYEKGAFTGAVSSKPGRFELAHEGTLFLDEIGDLPFDMQAKLLRVLQESSFERVGGIKTLHVNVRLVAATHINLKQAIAKGQFREDLFYRLHVVPIHLAPLRERREDIPLLARYFLTKHNERLERNINSISNEALQALQSYDWPGNIRELENVMERTVLFANQNVIEPNDLPTELQRPCLAASHFTPFEQTGDSFKNIVKKAVIQIEQTLISQALAETDGNITHAAKKLKISRKSLQIKIKEFAINSPQR